MAYYIGAVAHQAPAHKHDHNKAKVPNKIDAVTKYEKRHRLEKPSHVIVEEKPEGILIRKLEV
jgi:hypothetical protein